MSDSAWTSHRQPDAMSLAPANATPVIQWVEPEGGIARGGWQRVLLGLATFGLATAWTKVDVRRRTWSAIRIDGHPLSYTGTVREALVPMLVALGVLVLMAGGLAILAALAIPRPRIMSPSPWRYLVTLPLIYVIGLRLWRSKAYLLRRSQWRGTRGELHGSPIPFAATHLLTILSVPLTLGWIVPWRQSCMQRMLLGSVMLAGRPLEVARRPAPQWRPFLVPWAGAILLYFGVVFTIAFTVGPKIAHGVNTKTWPLLTWPEWALMAALVAAAAMAFILLAYWYRLAVLREAVAVIRFGDRALALNAKPLAFVRLAAGNLLLRLLTLGQAGPYAEARLFRFLVSNLVERPPGEDGQRDRNDPQRQSP